MKKILIVDDDTTNRKLLQTILATKGGYEVIEAENGVDALEKLTPDVSLVLLDLIMPVMNGIQFLQRFKIEKPECSNIPVLVLTTDDSKKQEALNAGAQEVIIKPINPAQLLEKVANHV
jgi:two-component system chemotaxis response regulator CheY/putative two-component system response regulator